MTQDEAHTALERRFKREMARRGPRPITWNPHAHSGLGYWARYLWHDPRDFAYCAPRRLACRLFGRHNPSCFGRPDHPRTW